MLHTYVQYICMIIDCALGGVNVSADLVQYSACQLQTCYTYYVGFCGKFGWNRP